MLSLYHGLSKNMLAGFAMRFWGVGEPLEVHVEMPGQEKYIEILFIPVQEVIHLIPVLRVICSFKLSPEAVEHGE